MVRVPKDKSRALKTMRSARAFWRGQSFARTVRGIHPATEPAKPGLLECWFDAHTEGPGIWKWRHLLATYDRHLAKFRGREVHILEIGVYSGGSMRMWRDYFGAEVHVYGVDIEPVCRRYEDDRTHIFIGDQADPNFWKEVLRKVPRLDIVVDDGGHEPEQQIATLESLLPNLQPGGVYICEDIMERSNPFHSYLGGLSRELHAHDRDHQPASDPTLVPFGNVRPTGLQRLVDSIHIYPFITVIEIRDSRIERFTAPRRGTEWEPTASAPWALPPGADRR